MRVGVAFRCLNCGTPLDIISNVLKADYQEINYYCPTCHKYYERVIEFEAQGSKQIVSDMMSECGTGGTLRTRQLKIRELIE